MSTNRPQTNKTREKKREQFTGEAKARSKTVPMAIVALVALAAIGGYLIWGSSRDNPGASPVAGRSGAGSGDVTIPIADLQSGSAKFFDYKLSSGMPIRFFAIRSSDGVYRAALDACDTCFHAKKGYHQEGDDMVCNNCGMKFHSARVNETSGGCNPVGLERSVEGDHLVIKSGELEKGARYF
ncbi:MAG TPA: DUF2318 domain-containing protein [Blastocatellia bacterium]|jgi:uncharacterized membrane protein|nr:DUF2318 domain-containing protein [Blastocatellia bacterium]